MDTADGSQKPQRLARKSCGVVVFPGTAAEASFPLPWGGQSLFTLRPEPSLYIYLKTVLRLLLLCVPADFSKEAFVSRLQAS